MLKLIQEAETRPKNFTGCVEDANGSKVWYQEGKLHRLDGPAVECPNIGFKAWYQEGKCHKLEGPVVEYPNGFLHDKTIETEGKKNEVTSFNAEFFVKHALQDTDGLSGYVTKVIEQFGKHTKKELVSVRDELKYVKPSSANEAGAVAIMLEVISQFGRLEDEEHDLE